MEESTECSAYHAPALSSGFSFLGAILAPREVGCFVVYPISSGTGQGSQMVSKNTHRHPLAMSKGFPCNVQFQG